MGGEQRFAFLRQRFIEAEHVLWPGWWTQSDDFFFLGLQADNICRMFPKRDFGRKARYTKDLLRSEPREYTQYLTRVAPQRLDVKPIRNSTIPLGMVLP